MQVLKILGLLILAGALTFAGMLVFRMSPRMSAVVPQPVITNFKECAAAGNPVMESYPEQCRTPDGRLFVRDVTLVQSPGESMTANGCAIAGCSQHLCVSGEEASAIMTTCEYKSEYACYKEASCEKQADGKCGWTQTPELKRCLVNPPAIDEDLQVQ